MNFKMNRKAIISTFRVQLECYWDVSCNGTVDTVIVVYIAENRDDR